MAKSPVISIAEAIARGAQDVAEGILRAGTYTIGAVSKLAKAVPGLTQKDAYALLKQASEKLFSVPPPSLPSPPEPPIGPGGSTNPNLPTNYRYVVRVDIRDTRDGTSISQHVTIGSQLPLSLSRIHDESIATVARGASRYSLDAGKVSGGTIKFATIDTTVESVEKLR